MKTIILPVHLKDKSTCFIEQELDIKIDQRWGAMAVLGKKTPKTKPTGRAYDTITLYASEEVHTENNKEKESK